MTQEWIEWLEIPQQQADTRKSASSEAGTPDVSSKRCPQCGWLDHHTVTECFRCGYNYLAGDLAIDYLKHSSVDIPAPVISTVEFDDWKPMRRKAKSILRGCPAV